MSVIVLTLFICVDSLMIIQFAEFSRFLAGAIKLRHCCDDSSRVNACYVRCVWLFQLFLFRVVFYSAA